MAEEQECGENVVIINVLASLETIPSVRFPDTNEGFVSTRAFIEQSHQKNKDGEILTPKYTQENFLR